MTAASVIAGRNQTIAVSSLFTAPTTDKPTYLIVSGLDRDNYTSTYLPNDQNTLGIAGNMLDFTNFTGGGGGYFEGIVYTLTNGQYVNSTYGNLSQLTINTGLNQGDVATYSLVGFNNPTYQVDAEQPYFTAINPAIFDTYSSVAIETERVPEPTPVASAALIASTALSYVGQVVNKDGCYTLAQQIAVNSGCTLPCTATLCDVAAQSNGQWLVEYDGTKAANANWVDALVAGDVVTFLNTDGNTGHITTVVDGAGRGADLVDNVEYVNPDGSIANPANDGSPDDLIVAVPHNDMVEFTGVNAATVVVYRLAAPTAPPAPVPVPTPAPTPVVPVPAPVPVPVVPVTPSPVEPTPITPSTVGKPVYRFYQPSNDSHLYTTNQDEASTLEQTGSGFNYEGIGFHAVDPTTDPTAGGVYRLYDSNTDSHLFTTSLAEIQTIQATLPNYHLEGIAFYADATVQPGDVAMTRFYDSSGPGAGQHFFTINPAEAAGLATSRPDMINEGTAFYVKP